MLKKVFPLKKTKPTHVIPVDLEKSDADFIAWCYRKILRREYDESGLLNYLERLKKGMSRSALIEEFFNSCEYENRFTGCTVFPPGHPLSPIPSGADIQAHTLFNWHPQELAGIDLRPTEQWELMSQLAKHYSSLPFPVQPQKESRYYYENTSYSYADAIILGCMIVQFKPQRIIEIGSGFSSAAILDINDKYFNGQIECCFIDPDPTRLNSLLTATDNKAQVMALMLQDLPLQTFSKLKSHDILFIDSSHVSKLGSDVNRLFFEVLPNLQKGTLIHIHDVFFPFEYPREWLEWGWIWNEQYLLRAFLQYNNVFSIRLFSSWLFAQNRPWFEENMPDCLKNTGGSLWLEKLI